MSHPLLLLYWVNFYTFLTCMINYFCWILMRWYFFTCIVVIHYFIIDTITWLCISFFLQSNEFIQWNLGTNVYTRKVWISYNIITVWYIRIICFTTVEIWVNSNTSPIIKLELNLPPLFFYWWRKHHHYLFYFLNTVSQYNLN